MSYKTMTLIVLFFPSLSQASTIENDELLLKSLIERGVICPSLTYEDNQEALRIYLNAKKVKSTPFYSKNGKEIKDTSELSNTDKITNKHQAYKTPKECIKPKSDNRSE
ncbi:hypothetical protein FQP88_00220 [Vibrio atlanticus]|nr:hypothetical protein FQP88_00220 [Vibrio atlanticus]